ncbi:MAG: right-handed parallel beta-helix repeat-containing protein, partial [Candidatus Aenigmatarchaeota archaeon]
MGSFKRTFLIFFFVFLFYLVFVFKAFPDYGLSGALNVTLNSPSDESIVNTKDVDFTFGVEWDDSIIITNCTLFGNFTGEWAANQANQTEIIEGENEIYLENLEDGAYEWNVYCYNETDVYDLAESNFTLTIDTEAPTYSLSLTNSTIAGSEIEHSMLWKDNVELDYAIFSLDNCTGEFENITEISLSEQEAWSNFTVRINETVGCEIKWKIYANDSAGNWNESETYSYITTYNPYLTDCSVLDQENGVYYLTADITDSSEEMCINITAKNVILDCQGYNIDGILGYGTVGIVVYNLGEETNVTIKNCNTTEWFAGIAILADGNTVFNSTSSFNNASGVVIQNGQNNKVINVTTENNMYFGIFIFNYSSYNEIINSTANGNNISGIFIYESYENQIFNSIFSENKFGAIISNSSKNILS